MTATGTAPRYAQVVSKLSAAQKSSRGAPGYSRWVNRRLGRYLAAWAYLRGMTPNQVTLLSAVFTFSGIGLIAFAPITWTVTVAAAAALVAGYALDAADGQLARLRGGGSPVGEWLDHVTDSVKNFSIHLAVLVAWYRSYDLADDALLLIPIGYAVVSGVFFFGMVLTDQLRKATPGRALDQRSDEPAPVLRSLLVLPNDYGVLCLVLAGLAWQAAFLPAYSVLLAANVLFLVAAMTKWYREVRALEVAGDGPAG